MLGWMKHKLKSVLPGEIPITSDMQMTPFMAESEEELKSLLMKVKEESEKVGSTFRKLRSWHLVPSLLETVTDFIFLGSKITADVDCSHEIKDPCSLEEKL